MCLVIIPEDGFSCAPPPTAMAFDFLGLRRNPEARSNSRKASIIGKSAIEVTKMVTSAYAINDV